MLQKTYQLVENLNEPMKYITALEDNIESNNKESVREDTSNIIVQRGNSNDNNNKQFEYADKVENLIKKTLSIFFLF